MSAPAATKRPPHFVTNGTPLVRELFRLIETRDVPLHWLAAESGVGLETIKQWRDRYQPILPNVEACFNALGYELIAVPRLTTGTDGVAPGDVDAEDGRRVLEIIGAFYRVSAEELLGRSREYRFAYPRQVAMWVMHAMKMGSAAGIGRFLGRDHTTVLHGLRAIERKRTCRAYRRRSNALRDRVAAARDADLDR